MADLRTKTPNLDLSFAHVQGERLEEFARSGRVSSGGLAEHDTFMEWSPGTSNLIKDGVGGLERPATLQLAIGRVKELLERARAREAIVTPSVLSADEATRSETDLADDSPFTIGASPPGPEDLTPTIDAQITPEIQTLANTLGKDPVKLFRFVRNGVDFEPYFGSVKGSVQTLHEGSGNDLDQASLLIALLRAAGIPARYVIGVAELPIKRVTNWIGVSDPEVALRIFLEVGIPAQAVLDDEDDDEDGDEITDVQFLHVWVEAFLLDEREEDDESDESEEDEESKWVQMDPSFKRYREKKGVNLARVVGLNTDQLLAGMIDGASIDFQDHSATKLNERFVEETLLEFQRRLLTFIEDKLEDRTTGDLFGKRAIRQEKGELEVPEEFAPLAEFREVPDGLRAKLRLVAFGLDRTFDLPELAGRRITLQHVPASEADRAVMSSLGGIYDVPAFLVQERMVLYIEGEPVDVGSPIHLGLRHPLFVLIGLPTGFVILATHVLTVGGYYSLILDLGRVTSGQLKERLQKFDDAFEKLETAASENLDTSDVPMDDLLGEQLNIHGLFWFYQVDAYSKGIGRVLDVRPVRGISEALTGFNLATLFVNGVPVRVAPAGMFIDAPLNLMSGFSVTGNRDDERAFQIGSGLLASTLEHGIFELLYDTTSISTINMLRFANARGIPIFQVSSENIERVLPRITTFPSVKSDIVAAVNAGLQVTIPQTNFEILNLFGTGSIVLDPETGGAGFLIIFAFGGGFGGAQASLTSDIDDPSGRVFDLTKEGLGIVLDVVDGVSEVEELELVGTGKKFFDWKVRPGFLKFASGFSLGLTAVETGIEVVDVIRDEGLTLSSAGKAAAIVGVTALTVAASGTIISGFAKGGAAVGGILFDGPGLVVGAVGGALLGAVGVFLISEAVKRELFGPR